MERFASQYARVARPTWAASLVWVVTAVRKAQIDAKLNVAVHAGGDVPLGLHGEWLADEA